MLSLVTPGSQAVCILPPPSTPAAMPVPVFSGLTQYSGDPQTEWDLNTFSTKEEVLAAMHSLHYRGGNTFTGLPLQPLPACCPAHSLPLHPSQTCRSVHKTSPVWAELTPTLTFVNDKSPSFIF